jgi:hypothetical protein
VDKVENLAEVAADAVEGVHDDRVAGPGVPSGWFRPSRSTAALVFLSAQGTAT